MIQDVIRDVREHFLDRIANPLTGAFVLSWCLWNYRFLMILLSGEHVVRKIHLIKVMVFPEPWRVIVFGIVLPLATALMYLFFYPRPARFVYKHALKQKKLTLEERRRVEEETVLTVGDSQRLKSRFAELELSHRAKRGELESVIEGLTEQVNLLAKNYDESERVRLLKQDTDHASGELTAELEELFSLQHEVAVLSAQNEELERRLRDSEGGVQLDEETAERGGDDSGTAIVDERMYTILTMLGHAQHPVYPRTVQEEMDVSHPLAKYLLKQLVDRGLAEQIFEEHGDGMPATTISDMGIKALLANGWSGKGTSESW